MSTFVPVIRIGTMPSITIDQAKNNCQKNEKGSQENQEDIFHYENEITENGGGRLQYH